MQDTSKSIELACMRTRTKICGITRVEDALSAVASGCDAIGLVFYEPSPRSVTIRRAKEICVALPPFVSVVALFVDASADLIKEVCNELPISLLQFHGNETEDECLGYGLPYMKAIRVQAKDDVNVAERDYPSASGILVDTYKAGVQGGTGETFDWDLLPSERAKPLILAGGLTPSNIHQAIMQVRPYAVDVSGGVEESKGIKSPELIEQFLKEVSRGSER